MSSLKKINLELIKRWLKIQKFFSKQWDVLPLYSDNYSSQSRGHDGGSLADFVEDEDDDGSSFYGSGGTARGNRGDNTKRAQRRAKAAGR